MTVLGIICAWLAACWLVAGWDARRLRREQEAQEGGVAVTEVDYGDVPRDYVEPRWMEER